MENSVKWLEKYLLSLEDFLSQRDIMKLFSCTQSRANAIRQKAIEYCLINDIYYYSKVPSEAVFEVTGKDSNYFYDKAVKEKQANELALAR